MAKIIMRHEMFNIKRDSFRTNVQSDNFHYIHNQGTLLDMGFKDFVFVIFQI
jgi:hypothetical protein